MENASKALIIAGAILLAILIISLGILIYNQAAGIANGNAMSEVEITQFNTQFTQYEGKQSGTTVRSLLQKVISSNLNQDSANKQVTVDLVDGGTTKPIIQTNTTAVPSNQITTGTNYTVSFTYGSSGSANAGLITKISITK